MKSKSVSPTGSLISGLLFGVASLHVLTAAVLFAGQTQRTLPGDRADGLKPRMGHPSSVPSGYMAGARQAWVASYTGVFDEEPTGMIVDTSGNVYVTGYGGAPDFYAFVTIKYNASGQEEWRAGYFFPNSINFATAIAIDHAGNVYVTGTSGTFGSGGWDYVTIKYSSSGQQQWVAQYNGPDNSDDRASAIAVDDLGNVYVTGTSGVSADYATLKYNGSGQQQWVARYSAQGNSVAIGVDNLGNVYVTGSSSGDYATIKYNNSGEEEWVARYPEGNPIAMAVDDLGSIYVTGSSAGDYATIKYDTLGQRLWVAQYNGTGNGDDRAAGLAIDDSGNVYVTGASSESDGFPSYATVKYNSVGQQQWASRYHSPDNLGDIATAITVSRSGNVYVTGMSWASSSASDYATIKYNSSGQEQWLARFDGGHGFDDYPIAIAVGRSDSVYVTGASRQDAIRYDWDFATIKYMSDRIPLPQPRP
jgi:hypothetical protein